MRPNNNFSKKIEGLLLNRNQGLENRPVFSIVKSLGKLSRRWLDPKFKFRKKAVRRMISNAGYSPQMAHELLDALFEALTEKKLLKLLKAEFGDPRVLDEFRYDKSSNRWQKAHGPCVITHIFSGNVPNPSIISFVLGMLIKSVNIGKASSRHEGFIDLYLESIKLFDRSLAKTNLLIDPKDKKSVMQAIRGSDLVVGYGHNQSLKEIRTRTPATAVFVGYGHRMSFGICTKESLNNKNFGRLAEATAYDIWLTDQRGCLSPLEIFIEAGGKVSLNEFSKALAKAVERRFSAKAWRMPSRRGGAHVVGFGGRKMIRVRSVKNIDEILNILKPFQPYLQAVSLEAGAKRRMKIASRLSALGVNRICRAGRMQKPPITWHHDGKLNLASWVHWTDLEI
ncbi:MAG: hypothetical protein AUJ72_04290 [Candidatus Omnitrophica bacterium CG1_02_46_14]|nr:MAG: hypothetical protein AUJ72_04290 [Candidatus Omnitrophica bacterium CG1_02_46_14]